MEAEGHIRDQDLDLEIIKRSIRSVITAVVKEAELQRKRNVKVYHEFVRKKT